MYLTYLIGFLDSGHTRTSSREVSKDGCSSSFTPEKLRSDTAAGFTLWINASCFTQRPTATVSVTSPRQTCRNMTENCSTSERKLPDRKYTDSVSPKCESPSGKRNGYH